MAKTELSRTINKIRTPLNLLNTFLGGGIPFGVAAQFFGATKCGKSTALLQTAEYFLQDYENGHVDIIDSEGNYTTSARLEKVFNLHPSNSVLETVEEDERVSFYRISSIEKAFMKIISLAKESATTKEPRLIIVDSISALSASSVVDEIDKAANKSKDVNVYAGGQSANAAVMTKLLGPLVDDISNSWATVIFINQVTVDRNTYGNPEIAKGGKALGHMLHLSVKFNMKSTSNQNNTNEETNKQYERFSSEVIEDESIKPITISSVTIDKNKLGISDSGGSSIMIDNLAGGRIVESFEIFETLAKSKGLLTAKGAYISLNDALKDKYKDLEVDHVDLKTGEIKTKKAIDNWVYKELVRSHGMADIVKKEILGYYFKNIIAIRNEYKQIYQIAQSKKLPSPIDYPTMLLEYNVTDSEYPKSE